MPSTGSRVAPARLRRARRVTAEPPTPGAGAAGAPLTWTFDWDAHPGLLLVRVAGSIQRSSLAALRLDILAQPRIAGVRGYIIDFRGGDITPLTPADVRSLAAADATEPSGAQLPRAFVVSDAQAVGLASVYLGHMRGRDAPVSVNAFTTVEAALDWLAPGAGGITPR